MTCHFISAVWEMQSSELLSSKLIHQLLVNECQATKNKVELASISWCLEMNSWTVLQSGGIKLMHKKIMSSSNEQFMVLKHYG